MDLTVGELSLVDAPANEAVFVVTKNQKEQQMKTPKTAPEGSDTATAERVPVEVSDDGSNPAVLKALEHIDSIVSTVTKSKEAPAPATSAAASESAKDESEGGEETEKAKKTYSMREAMKKLFSGSDDATFEKAMGLLKAAGLDPNAKFQDKQPPVTKAAEAPAPEMTAESVMDILATAVQKAKSFTPDRVEKLKSAMEILKLMIDDVGMGNVPATSTPGVKTSPASALQDVKTSKAADEGPVAKALGEIAEVLKAFVPRLESVENEVKTLKSAKPAPEGETNGGTENKVAKSGNLWSGVI